MTGLMASRKRGAQSSHIDFHVICGIEELTHVETMYVDVHVFEYVEYVLQLGVHKFHRMGGLGLRRSE